MPINDEGIIKPLSRASSKRYTREGVNYWFGEPCDSGHLTLVTVPIVGRMYVHERVANAFVSVFREIEEYDRAHLIDMDDYGGTYNCRNVRGADAKSPHSWGIAVDLNVHHFRGDGGREETRGYSNFHCDRDEIAPSLRELAYHFTRWGFTWGGHWNDAYIDPMHFEATEQTIFRLDEGGPQTQAARKVVLLPGWENNAKPLFHEGAHYLSVRQIEDMFDVTLFDRREENGVLYFVKRTTTDEEGD